MFKASVLPRLAAATAILVTPAIAMAQGTPSSGAVPTFTKDVAPILQRSCVTCHRPGESAPMSLMTFDDARPWARSIKTRVSTREMPPWHIDRNIGIQKFKDDPSLSDKEIATIVKWVDSGAPRGNPADMPPLRQFGNADEWQIGTPEMIVRFPVFKMPATGPDLFGSLYTTFDSSEDRYIKAVQTKAVGEPARKVVHHALSFTVPADTAETQSDGDDSNATGGGQFLVEYASGKNAEIYPDDSGLLVEKGMKMKLDYHFHSIGEPVDTVVEVGIVFHPKGHKPKNVRWSKQLGQHVSELDIPGGEMVRTDGYTRLNRPARITAFQPHMHIRGKYQCLELIYPTSSTPMVTEMISCAHFNYNWHLVYNYADDVAPIVPAGTILHVISWHDNTPNNKFNPDPKNWVGQGNRTIDEMGFSWIGWVDLTEEDYKKEFEERKARRQRTSTSAPSSTAQQQQQ
jgi:hypothetical protein